MKIENLDEELVAFIMKYLPMLEWEGSDTSAQAELLLDEYKTIDDELMDAIGKAIKKTRKEEFVLTIRPSENKLIIYYIDQVIKPNQNIYVPFYKCLNFKQL